MPTKIIRDPLYNYIAIDKNRDAWLLGLIDTPEFQRLRRVHQLGLSFLTYPGADHNRLAHSLGVFHLMNQVMDHLISDYPGPDVRQARGPLLAAALVHDVGHGPFSHVFEVCMGVDHLQWSIRILQDDSTGVHQVLAKHDPGLPLQVAELIDPQNHEHPAWQKYLLSSQLDMDRLDYLRRDSLFTGADYGHFDWYRLIHSLELHGPTLASSDIVWPEKASLAIEEFIFARYYMYRNVYLHKTTRGFERLLEAVWQRAQQFFRDGEQSLLLPQVREFWSTDAPSVEQYLAVEEFTMMQQVQNWTQHRDPALRDLSRRFLHRERLALVAAPDFDGDGDWAPDYDGWELALKALIGRDSRYQPPEMYCLVDRLRAKYNQPYHPEKEDDEQSVKNAIRVLVEGSRQPLEISQWLPRLRSVTEATSEHVRYYIPKDLQKQAQQLRLDRSWRTT